MSAPLERVQRSVFRVLSLFAKRIDYAGHYPATVVSQNDDGSLELRTGNPKLGDLSKVGISYGVPGVSVKVKSGGEVLIGWMGADPALPYALVYDQATVESLSLLGGTKPVARLGDALKTLIPPTAIFVGTVVTSGGTVPLTGPAIMTKPFAGILTSGQLGALA